MDGVIPSPNIWNSPAVYELENRAVDPDGNIEAAMRRVRDWAGADVLDIGCGSGFHLPRFNQTARTVIGVEPHPPLVELARRRVRALGPLARSIEVRAGTAQDLPVAPNSVDVAHARWAYFFGPGCEPGLAELDRVMRRGGVAFLIDNDLSTSTFARWVRRAYPTIDHHEVERFFSQRGWQRQSVPMRWVMNSRADFESVIRIEFAPEVVEAILAKHPGHEVDYAVNVHTKTF